MTLTDTQMMQNTITRLEADATGDRHGKAETVMWTVIENEGGHRIVEVPPTKVMPGGFHVSGCNDCTTVLLRYLNALEARADSLKADLTAAREQVRVLAEAWRTITERDDQGGLYHNGSWLPLRQQLAVLGVFRALAAVEETK